MLGLNLLTSCSEEEEEKNALLKKLMNNNCFALAEFPNNSRQRHRQG